MFYYEYKLNINFLISDIVSQFNFGLARKVRFIKMVKTPLAIRIFRILYNNGIIRTMKIDIDIFLFIINFLKANLLVR